MHTGDPKSERIHLASQEPLTRGDLVSFSGLEYDSENISIQNRNSRLTEIFFLSYLQKRNTSRNTERDFGLSSSVVSERNCNILKTES